MNSAVTTIETITNAQIRALSNGAGEAGDLEMVAICERALDTDVSPTDRSAARAECVKAINYAEGMADD